MVVSYSYNQFSYVACVFWCYLDISVLVVCYLNVSCVGVTWIYLLISTLVVCYMNVSVFVLPEYICLYLFWSFVT